MLDHQTLGRCHMVHPSRKRGAWLVCSVCIQVRACSPYAIRRCVSCNPNVVPVLAVAVSLLAVPPGGQATSGEHCPHASSRRSPRPRVGWLHGFCWGVRPHHPAHLQAHTRMHGAVSHVLGTIALFIEFWPLFPQESHSGSCFSDLCFALSSSVLEVFLSFYPRASFLCIMHLHPTSYCEGSSRDKRAGSVAAFPDAVLLLTFPAVEFWFFISDHSPQLFPHVLLFSYMESLL